MSTELSAHHAEDALEAVRTAEDKAFSDLPALIGLIHKSGASVQGRITIRRSDSETEVTHEIAYETKRSTLARLFQRISIKLHLNLDIRASLKNLLTK